MAGMAGMAGILSKLRGTKEKLSPQQEKSQLLGAGAERLGALAPAAETFLDLANRPRYGMTERDRSQLIGRLPGSPPYGPEAERYTSAYLFARQNPALVGLVGPANKLTDWMYGSNLAPQAQAGIKAYRESGQNPYDPSAMTPFDIAKQEDERKRRELLAKRGQSN
jgi:hypothetical protein